MLVVYDSRTGNVRRFVEKLNMKSVSLDDGETADITVDEPFVLVTFTTGFGQVPDRVEKFLRRNSSKLRGVSASGNRNWGESFAKSADDISKRYNVPVIHKFELSGTGRDVDQFRQGVNKLAAY
ncbi:protein involved in ribonucleotide reduction [Paenibacillus cellulosilyticus]|uniref:Protein NrdI n=1 Tax=Paenibacillus cellulosilyticus TaxID=375489 RepID=A0A2V2YPK5_9BACL|nr:class Ib ribonucleoside-diphosphate reductase assembly flavoprotein NrdI [Paenibacillus cellulosilyticus]PWV97923.1 protein involved in ribonucleotide reduction [Paenibacillus cellulosilyticus]QKS44039.1 class Ib ribonucleoside-diphosphate reductase assembly flavoprotein NrdI [Paenibacillus cellulosilyticus]